MSTNQETSALGLTLTTGGDEHPLPLFILDDDARLRAVAHRVVDSLIDGRDYQTVQGFCEAAMWHMFDDDSGGIQSRAIANEFYDDIVEEDKLSPDARQKVDDFCRVIGDRHGFVASIAVPRILAHVLRFKRTVVASMVARDRDSIPEPEASLLDAMSEPDTEPVTAEEVRKRGGHGRKN